VTGTAQHGEPRIASSWWAIRRGRKRDVDDEILLRLFPFRRNVAF